MNKFKILICGAFGYGNLGDDILCDTFCNLLYNRYENVEIYVDRPYPDCELIKKCDLRIIGPGGLLYDNDKGHVDYFSKYLKEPFILYGIGIQYPLYILNETESFVRNAIKKSDIIVGRDLRDLEIYKEILNDKINKVKIIPDLAFFSKELKKTYLPFEKKKNHITFCLNEELTNKEILNIIKNNKNIVGSLLSFHIDDDKFINECRKNLGVERTSLDYYYGTIHQAYNVISNSDLLITNRYHAAIMAVHAGVKVSLLKQDDGNITYKLKGVTNIITDFKSLINDKEEYINKINKIDKINNIFISDIKNIDPLEHLDIYLKEKFNINRK